MNRLAPIDFSFARDAFDMASFARNAFDMVLDPWQLDFLNNPSKRVLLNCSRQTGKSTICSVGSMHEAIFFEGATILVIAKNHRQAIELLKKSKKGTDYAIEKGVLDKHGIKAGSIEFLNGSRIIALPSNEEGIRSFSATSIFLDEASRVEDQLYISVNPMVSTTKGRIVALSTPNGKKGWWFNAWKNGGDNWARYKVDATECARIPREFLASQREELGETMFLQEYFCEFVDAEDQIFSYEDIERAFNNDFKMLHLPPTSIAESLTERA